MILRKIVSFGYRHADPPEETQGIVVVDVRPLFRNPWGKLHLRTQTGLDPDVQAEVRRTPEFQNKYRYVYAQVMTPGTEIAYIGCYGGKHRSVFLAHALAEELGVPVEHRDLTR